ncbi:ammonia channel protein AmtB [Streptomyces sp. AK010]|nr:ammonia channel protein AmtB [Streptomyces sp. AK010]
MPLLIALVRRGGAEGLRYGGGLAQLGKQLLAVAVVGVYAFGVTYGIGRLIDATMGLRATEEQEQEQEQEQTGLDLTVHAETAYDHGVLGHGAPVSSSVVSPAQKVTPQA